VIKKKLEEFDLFDLFFVPLQQTYSKNVNISKRYCKEDDTRREKPIGRAHRRRAQDCL
jgi:hypothetical protein